MVFNSIFYDDSCEKITRKCRKAPVVKSKFILKQGHLYIRNKRLETLLKYVCVTKKYIYLGTCESEIEWFISLKFKYLQKFQDQHNYEKGFRIGWGKSTVDFVCEDQWEVESWVVVLKPLMVLTNIERDIQIDGCVNMTKYSRVYRAHYKDTQQVVAVKAMKKNSKTNFAKNLKFEISIMKKIKHAETVKLIAVYENNENVFIVMQYLGGHDLQYSLRMMKRYSEREASVVIKRLLEIVSSLHKQGIIHRDLKPQNLLMKDSLNPTDFKLSDFGLACYSDAQKKSVCGTAGYMAPEVINALSYSFSADVYSIGVIFFTLLSGVNPFTGSSREQVMSENSKGRIRLKGELWKSVSRECRMVISSMTSVDPLERLSCNEALKLSFFKEI